jgi:hypothetical protein
MASSPFIKHNFSQPVLISYCYVYLIEIQLIVSKKRAMSAAKDNGYFKCFVRRRKDLSDYPIHL